MKLVKYSLESYATAQFEHYAIEVPTGTSILGLLTESSSPFRRSMQVLTGQPVDAEARKMETVEFCTRSAGQVVADDWIYLGHVPS